MPEGKPQGRSLPRDLVFQDWTDDTGVFYDLDAWMHLHRIQRALYQSETWGEFFAAIPAEELAFLRERLADGGQELPEDPLEPFNRYVIPGVGDGDYPDWCGASFGSALPKVFLEKYGQTDFSGIGQTWLSFPRHRLAEMKAELAELGYEVVWEAGY